MTDRRWYVDFFGEDYLAICGPGLTKERTEREADQIVELLGLAPAGVDA